LIDRLDLSALRNTGYSALPELLLLVVAAGGRIVEVPITFVEREQGATKLTQRELLNSLVNLIWLRRRRVALADRHPRLPNARHLVGRASSRLSESPADRRRPLSAASDPVAAAGRIRDEPAEPRDGSGDFPSPTRQVSPDTDR
jgi:hypothetical protein